MLGQEPLFAPHLNELRKRILTAFVFFAIASAISFYFIEKLLRILKMPAAGEIGTLAVFSPTAAIISFFKIALSFGFISSIPVFLYEIWMFILPALEKRYVRSGWWFIFSGTVLFISGVLFSFFFLVPASIKFLLGIGKGELQFIISLDSYISFVLMLLLASGVVFEIPVLVYILSKLGILTSEKMLRRWREAIVVILIVAALVTPTPDIINMLIISIPMFVLYFISIGVSQAAQKKSVSIYKR